MTDVLPTSVKFHHWTLGFGQSSSHHIAQALQGGTIPVFCYPPLSNHALVPSPFRVEVRRSPRSHFALNSGPLQGQFAPCVPRRTVSLHPAQASQRPGEGPVSSPTTCWLHDTRQTSMPVRGREHQCNKATDMCHTFCVDSSGVLVPRHRREVSPLACRVMFQPVSAPLQSGMRFFPPPYPHRHWLALQRSSLQGRSSTGLPRSTRLTGMGEVLSVRR